MPLELIPWRHNIHSSYHDQALAFIKTIPKGSVLAFESFPKYHRVIEIMRQAMVNPETTRKIFGNARLGQIDEMTLAMMEVMHECEKRGIKLFPVTSNIKGMESMKVFEIPARMNNF